MSKKAIKIISLCLMMGVCIMVILFIKYRHNNNSISEGRWSSKDDSIIKIVKEYMDDKPVYDNDNIVEYWLDIKENGEYILYYIDVSDKGRSNFSILENITEKGKYNIDNKDAGIIYFSPISNNHSFIWTCHIKNDNNLYDCNNYSTDFVKQAER